MCKYLYLRQLQLKNFIKKNGTHTIFILIGILVSLLIISNSQIQKVKDLNLPSYLFILNLIVLYFFKLNRKDLRLLSIVFKNIVIVQILDYCFISIPFLLIYLINEWYANILLLFVLIIFISRTEKSIIFQVRSIKNFIGYGINYNNYEWISGLRKYYVVIALIIILSLSLFWHKFLTIIFLGSYVLLLPGFYTKNETSIFLESCFENSKNVISTKIKDHCRVNLLILSSGIPYVIFNFENAYLFLILSFLSIIMIIWLIVCKYKYYKQDNSGFKNILISNLVGGCMV